MISTEEAAIRTFVPEEPPSVQHTDVSASSNPGGRSNRGFAVDLLQDIVEKCRLDAERYPHSPRSVTNYGLALLNAGQLEEADAEFSRALKIDAAYFVALEGRARVYRLSGKVAEAVRLYGDLAKAHPENPLPLIHLADIQIADEQFDAAIYSLRGAISRDPNVSLPRFQLAAVLLHSKRYREAIAELKVASRADIRNPFLHHAMGVGYAMIKDLGRARKAFEVAIRLAPRMDDAVHALAKILVAQGNFESTVALLSPRVDKEQEDYEARELLAWAYVKQENYLAARKQLNKAFVGLADDSRSVLNRARIANNLGICYVLLKTAEHAEQLFQASIEMAPTTAPVPYLNLGRLYLQQERFDKAFEVLDRCDQRFPEVRQAKELRAAVLYAGERYAEAADVLDELVKSGQASAHTFAALASLYVDWKQDPGAALTVLGKAKLTFPRDAKVANNLAYTHLMLGDTASARAALKPVPELRHPDSKSHPVFIATQGLLRIKEGNLEQGAQGYEMAARVAQARGLDDFAKRIRQKKYLELARAYIRMGNLKLAVRSVTAGLAIPVGRGLFREELLSVAHDLGLR